MGKFNQRVFGAQLKDKKKKAKSQSGGAFTAFAEKILIMEGIVYGVCLDEKLQAVYQRINNSNDLHSLKGSKYVQALIGDNYIKVKRDLKDDRYVLFSGTPCYVDGLLNYLRDCDTSKLFTVDIVCHGVPSPLIYNEYLTYISKGKKNKIAEFNFRDKSLGWHIQYETYLIREKRRINNIYARLFSSHVCLRDSCYSCKYTNFKRVSDITIGDFWGIEKFNSQIDDNTGISLVIVNTVNGEKLFNLSKEEFEFFNSTLEECKQPQLCYPSKKSTFFDEFWRDYYNVSFKKIVFKYGKGGVKGIIKTNTIKFTKKIRIYKIIKKLFK